MVIIISLLMKLIACFFLLFCVLYGNVSSGGLSDTKLSNVLLVINMLHNSCWGHWGGVSDGHWFEST